MKKLLILTVVVLSLGMTKHKDALTAQYPDKIKFNGIEYSLNSNPLEQYFEKHPGKRPKGEIMSTALWRGYVAHFEIIDKQLFVTDIKIQVRDKNSENNSKIKWISVYKEVFPNTEKTKVDWYSSILILPYGKLISYVHLAYGSTYSNYWLIEIENGYSNEARNYNYKEYTKFKKRQFLAFKKTKKYKHLFNELNDDNTDDESVEDFIYQYITEYTTKFLKE